MSYHIKLHNWILFLFRYAVDLVVCAALGADMFDCVYPTRTAVSFAIKSCCKSLFSSVLSHDYTQTLGTNLGNKR